MQDLPEGSLPKMEGEEVTGGDAHSISLFPFQREDVDHLATQHSALIANEMGRQAQVKRTKPSSETQESDD
jgi:hypothetical protein